MKFSKLLIPIFTSILIFSINFNSLGQNKIDRLEPAFWWAGMVNPELQLMVYGENINELNPEISYPGIRVDKVIKVQNPNYLFIDLILDKDVTPGSFDIKFLLKGKEKTSFPYQLLKRDEGSADRIGIDPSDVIYLITPDRFANGNPDNDELDHLKEKKNRADKFGRHGGDIKGIGDNLDYIQGLGFSAIWLNPILENDQIESSYHGYATTDFYKVDERFGSNESYQKLAKDTREKDVKLIMDMILNHCGSGHWWMKDLPTADWINYQNEYVQTNHRRTVIQDPYAAKSDKSLMSDGWFVRTMPDLNQKNALMATYLIQNTIWWTEYLGLAGIRMDTYPYPDKDFMADWTCKMMAEYPNFNIVGEEWSENPSIVAHWQRGKVNANGYFSCLPSVMDFPLQAALRRSLTSDHDGFLQLYEMLANDFVYAEPENLVIFPDNHDMNRFYAQVGEDVDLLKLGLTYMLTTRGIPQIYYGTEILMSNPGDGDHGIIRSDFPGGWEGDEINGFTGKGLTEEQKEMQEWLKKVITWRNNNAVVHYGKLLHFAPLEDIYVYFRYHEDKKVMVILNKNTEEKTLQLDRFQEIIGKSTSGSELFGGKTVSLENTLTLPGKSPIIIELN
ncbi:MAG: glycoside hydrolase family 13 protein [Flammeovirgaceae bacterium]|nr:glycoside hydrolase family 13 protein [Flammeovirgaceae bacterium]